MAVFTGLNTGAVEIPFDLIIIKTVRTVGDLLFLSSSNEQNDQIATIILDIRLPRVFLALFVGAILAISGAVMQGLSLIHI